MTDVTEAATSPAAKQTLLSLLDQMTRARAAELARAGRYAEAEEVLSAGGGGAGDGPATLDLLARIRAQQGRLAEAEKLWERAARLDPANPAYARGLRRAASPRRGWGRPLTLLPLVACGLLCASLGYWWWRRPPEARGAGAAPTQSAQTRPAAPQGEAAAPPPQAPAAPVDAESAAARAPVENRINVRGVTVTRAPDGLVLSFDEGLFRRGLTLMPGARERLAELGRQLGPYAGDSSVRIVGMTDESPMPRRARYRDNVSLGMDRARLVYDHLRLTPGLDSDDLTIGSAGARRTRGDSARAADRARDRTVVLHIGARLRRD
ncbi:MAG TPA: tetratricopeptide repeat protein [Pyrinomonadaceae bacterium]